MEKERAIELWQEHLSGIISEENNAELQSFIIKNPELRAELESSAHTWDLLGQLKRPEPSAQMDARFHAMMAAQKQPKESLNISELFMNWIARGWQVGLASLIIGVIIGGLLLPSTSQNKEVASLTDEIQEMKKMMMLTLIQQPKAQDRIQAVNMASGISSNDSKVIDALIATLNTDDNLNVRLAAVETLTSLGNSPKARRALVSAIGLQESPIVQVAIADALVLIQAKNSVKELEKLRETVEDDLVKFKLDESIKTLKSI